MSIISSFDNKSNEILRPAHIARKIEGFPEIVILTFKTEIIKELLMKYEVRIIDELHAGFTIPVYKFKHNGKDIALYQTLIGAAGTAGLFEEVIVKGGKKFLIFGSCGSLDKNLSEGNFIIPTAAYRDEGVSYHYMAETDYIEIKTADKLAEIFDNMNLPYIKGKTWTTDALYRETEGNMRKRKLEGCLTVEMECASIMAVSNFRNVLAYQFLYAEDNLDSKEWEARSMGRVARNVYEKYLNIALDIASQL